MRCDVLLVFEKLVADGLFDVSGARAEGGHAIDHVGDEMKAVQIVHHYHVKRSRGRAFCTLHQRRRLCRGQDPELAYGTTRRTR